MLVSALKPVGKVRAIATDSARWPFVDAVEFSFVVTDVSEEGWGNVGHFDKLLDICRK
jgi:hypothetical protein